jgi:hypothetical protein
MAMAAIRSEGKIMMLIRFAAALLLLTCTARLGIAAEWPPTAADISVTLSRANSGCTEGNDCRLAIQVENLGTAPFKGALKVTIDTAAPSVPGFVGSERGTCERLAYGRMACTAASIELQPAETLTDLVSVRFLPTVMNEARTCASIDWRGSTGGVARDAVKSVAASLGKGAPAVADANQLLSAVFGTWGNGDLRADNDRGCVTIAIGSAAVPAQCPEGQERIAGGCVALDDFCSAARVRDAKSRRCACSVATDRFDPVSRACVAAAAPTCDGGRTAKDGLCFCPEARPLWNAKASACEEWRQPEPKPATVAVETPPPPVARPKVTVPVKKVVAPVKRRVVVKPVKKTVAAKPERSPVSRRVTRRAFESPSAVWRREVKRCPPIIPYCWARVIRRYSKYKRLVRGG